MEKEMNTREASDVNKSDIKQSETKGITDIKPETDISKQESDHYWKNEVFKNTESEIKGNDGFNSYEDKLGHTPKEDSNLGSWQGERGESTFTPNETTPEGKAALEKLAEKGQDGIEYKNAEPDFSKCAEATVKIDNMTENRLDYYESDGTLRQGNFTQADIKCSEKWNLEAREGRNDWTARDVNDWRHDNNCSWHERCDTTTMDLVSSDIHSQCKHLGGVSECKVRDSIDIGGEFDD